MYLQPTNLDTLCHSVVVVAETHCTAAIPQATAIEAKHKKALLLFHECHKLYDSNAITDAEIETLGKGKNPKLY